MTHYGDKTNR